MKLEDRNAAGSEEVASKLEQPCPVIVIDASALMVVNSSCELSYATPSNPAFASCIPPNVSG